MQILDLAVKRRDKLGSAESRRYRRAGKIPCVLYGHGQENVHLIAEALDFGGVLKAHSALVRLKLGDEAQTALVREVKWDTFGEQVAHIDLIRVEMEDEVKIKVPIHYVGIPAGTHEGGEMQIIHPDIEVFARVDSIPSEIRIDVSELLLHEGIVVGAVEFPGAVRPAGPAGDLLVHVVPPRKVEAAPVAGLAEGEEEAAAPAGDEPATPADGGQPAGS